MTKIKKEKMDLSLDKLSELLKNPPQNVYVSIYTKIEEEVEPVGRSSEKMTLSKLAEEMRAGFKQVNDRIDKIEQRLDRVEHRLDLVEQRLDYNGLKPLPNKQN